MPDYDAASFAALCDRLGRPLDPRAREELLGPSPTSLFACSEALTMLGIGHDAFEADLETLDELALPHLAHVRPGALVVVTRVAPDEIELLRGDVREVVARAAYGATWSGAVLAPTGVRSPSLYVPAPRPRAVPRGALVGLALLVIAAGLATLPLATLPLALVTIAGLALSAVLAAEELGIANAGQRLCSLGPKASCKHVLASPAARLGPLSMADVGVAYFAGSLVLLCLGPSTTAGLDATRSLLRVLDLCALPYTVFSIAYQALRVKRWCPACVLVQAALWLEWVLLRDAPLALPLALLPLALFALLPAIAWLLVKPTLYAGPQLAAARRTLARLRRDPAILSVLLAAEPEVDPPSVPIQLPLGPAQAAQTLALYTDPTCAHCREMLDEVTDAIALADGGLRADLRICGPAGADPGAKALMERLARALAEHDPARAGAIYERWHREARVDDAADPSGEVATASAASASILAAHAEAMRGLKGVRVPMVFLGKRRWPSEIPVRNAGLLARPAEK